MEYCKTPESFRKNSKEIDKLLVYGQWTRTNCSCQRQCNQDFYVAYTEMTKMKPTESKISKLRVFYQVQFDFADVKVVSTFYSFKGFHVWRNRRVGRLRSCFPTLRYRRIARFPAWLFRSDRVRDCRRHRSNLSVIQPTIDQQMQRSQLIIPVYTQTIAQVSLQTRV